MLTSPFLILPFITSVLSTPFHSHEHRHEHDIHKRLPGSWHQPREHAVHNLFRRAVGTFSDVGSSDWSKGFPDDNLNNIAKVPQAWKDALDKAVSSGKIPNIPATTVDANLGPIYPKGVDPMSPQVCSSTQKCRQNVDYVVWDAPDGVWASSFDDGPQEATGTLMKFLGQNNLTTTHFLIGTNVIGFADQFKAIAASNDDIAVHTWTHPYMTSMTNEQVVGQLGWTMQIIHDSTKGKVPKYWRPPYGDSDARVAAIAKEVFGMITVIWNQDTDDWAIATNGQTEAKAKSELEGWMAGPKSPGLMPLEHELTETTVGIFMSTFPDIAKHGWKFQSLIAALEGNNGGYQSEQNFLAMFGELASTSNAAPTPSANATSSSASAKSSSTSGSNTTHVVNAGSSNGAASTHPAFTHSLVLAVVTLLSAIYALP